jgi:nitrate reductase delta subunit
MKLFRPPAEAPHVTPTPEARVVYQAAALCLSYPDEHLVERLDLIEEAVAPTAVASSFTPLLEHLRAGPANQPVPHDATLTRLARLQGFHVQEFDLSRRHALHLTYWTDGDTRRRGETLAGIKQRYRDSGMVVTPDGELPDYLPMMLEFAVADPERGMALLQEFRASLEMLRLGLLSDDLPHAGALDAICHYLPGESAQSRAEAQERFGRPQPVEFVGLNELVRK